MTRLAFGLACDVERTPETASGYKPALEDLGAAKYLFGQLRILGWAKMLELYPDMHLTIVGGDEGRYKSETPVVNRAEMLCKILIMDYGVAPDRLAWFASKSNTLGNVGIIKEQSRSRDDIVVTNHYHGLRAWSGLREAGLDLQVMPAEAFIILADFNNRDLVKEQIIAELGGGPLAERDAEEIQGLAQMFNKTYQSRTDVAPVTFGSKQPV